jgi:hypothetical protein
LDLIKVKADKKQGLFNELVYQKRLKEIAVPPHEVSHPTRKIAYVLPTVGEKLSDAFSGISGNGLLKNTPKTGVFLNG